MKRYGDKVGMEHVHERPHVQLHKSHPHKYPNMWCIHYKQVKPGSQCDAGTTSIVSVMIKVFFFTSQIASLYIIQFF